MLDQEFGYDVFLSHAGEDTAWCESLAERLRNEGVRVWFDQWEMQPGDNVLAKINEGLAKSRKMVAVWSANYFRDGKIWTLVESFSQLHGDPLSQDRPIIPLLIAECAIPPTFRNILFIDARNQHDFDLRFRQLLQALDLPRREFEHEPDFEFKEHDFEAAKRGRLAQKKGKRFEDEVAKLYELLGFSVKRDAQLHGFQIDLQIEKREGGLLTQVIVECKDKRIAANERDQILAQQNLAQKKLPAFRWIAVSSEGFAADTRLALEEAGVCCLTYAGLLRELVPLDQYNEHLIADYETWVHEKWHGEDWYIRPHLLTDITYEKQPVLAHFAKWLGSDRSNFLVLLGDLGTGKSTLARFLAYNLALSFRADPLRHPAPVLIQLKDVRKENSLESMIISHFSKVGLPGINFPRFEHLVRLGKIFLLFDAFDEMAVRVRWEETKNNFAELRRATEQNSKVILTCRTHYFKDRTEQVKLIGQGPRLSEIETELYRELRQQSNAEVVYLQEFNDEQIQAYLRKARPQTAVDDWQKIQSIYNLKELAQRPLLLDMIVKSLPKLESAQIIDAANLYTVYTNLWVEREFHKGRVVLDKNTKLELMMELSWRMWHEEKDAVHYKDAIHYQEIVPFVKKLSASKILQFGDEETQDIADEMQTASFLKRNEAGCFTFMHRSFMEYFLARKLFACVADDNAFRTVLNTRRLDRKVVYFLSLLDKQDRICQSLQQILINAYSPNVSENALQILYWSGRIRCGMEEKIDCPDRLRDIIAERIPLKSQLAGANLQEMMLEASNLINANMRGANLTKTNLNYANLSQTNFYKARLLEARAERVSAYRVDFREADLSGILFSGASLIECDFTAATYDPLSLKIANMQRCKGVPLGMMLRLENLQAFVQLGHGLGINALAISPDGNLLVSVGADGLLILYHINDGKILRVIPGHQCGIKAVNFSFDGSILASGSENGIVRLWKVHSGEMLCTMTDHQYGINSIDFSPDSSILVSGGDDNSVLLWDSTSGKMLKEFKGHKLCVNVVRFSSDGLRLASGSSDNSVILWDVQSAKKLLMLIGHLETVWSLSFSRDGSKLVTGSDDKSVRLWDVRDGKTVMILEGQSGGVRSVCFAPDESKIASGSDDNIVRLFDVRNIAIQRSLVGHDDVVTSVSFSPDGSKLVSGSLDHSVRSWDLASGRISRVFAGHHYGVNFMQFSSDGMKLATGCSDKNVRLWHMASRRMTWILAGHKDPVRCVQFIPHDLKLASGGADQTIRLWDLRNGKVLRVLTGHQDSVNSLQLSPDSTKLASGSSDRTIRLWDVQSSRFLRTLSGHQDSVNSLHFSPDGLILASGSSDHTVRLWDSESGKMKRLLIGHKDYIRSLQFSPDGKKLASGSDDESVWLWDVVSGRMLKILNGHRDYVRSIQFSSDGLRLASGSSDHTVRLWEVETGKCLQVLEGHLGQVYTVCFSPNGKYLVAAGAAGRLQFWDHEKGETFLYRYAFGPGAWLDLLPDGRFDASPEGMRYLCYTEQGTLNSYTAEELVKEFYDPQAVQEVLEKYVK